MRRPSRGIAGSFFTLTREESQFMSHLVRNGIQRGPILDLLGEARALSRDPQADIFEASLIIKELYVTLYFLLAERLRLSRTVTRFRGDVD